MNYVISRLSGGFCETDAVQGCYIQSGDQEIDFFSGKRDINWDKWECESW